MQFRVRPSSRKSTNNDNNTSVEFPTLKTFVPADSSLRSFSSKVDHLENALANFQQLYRRERQITNAGYLQIQKRLDKVEYKTFSAEQDLRQLSEIREIKPLRESYSNNQGDSSKNEVMMLKQVILQEKQAQKESLKHQNAILEQMNIKQMRTEQQLRELVIQQRMEYEYRLSGQGQQLREMEGLKQRKMQQQYEMMKGVISNAERKIFDELERKIRNQTVVKEFVQDKMAQLKEQLAKDQNEVLITETKFIRQTKQSLESLFGLMNNLKKDLSEELAETQKLAITNIKKLSTVLEITRQKTAEEMKEISQVQTEISNELVEIRNFMTTRLQENRQFMSQFEQQTMDRIEHSGVYSREGSSKSIDGERFNLFQKQINQWKSITEQKNLNVFKQISNTLKAMKLQWRKENDQLVSEVASLTDELKTVRKSGPSDLKKNIQAILAIFNNQFDVLAEEIENVADMIALAKRENDKIMKEEVNKVHHGLIEQMNTIISLKSKETNQYTDRVLSRTEENMKNQLSKDLKFFADSQNKRMEKAETDIKQLEATIKKNNLNTTAQLEDYSLKLKSFNDNYKQYLEQQRKQDGRKRMQLEENMRKNASNLMDICYKKSEFLVEGLKKNIEMAQMKDKMENTQALEGAKDEFKKDIQLAKFEWQKELSANSDKMTKERQNSQQILHEAMEQSISNAKNKLSDDFGSLKIQLEEKISEIKLKSVQKDAENEAKANQLKQSVEKILAQQKKATEDSMESIKKQLDQKLLPLATQKDVQTLKFVLEERFKQLKDQLELDLAKLQDNTKKEGQENNKHEAELKTKQDQLQKKLNNLEADNETKYKTSIIKVEQLSKKIAELEEKIKQQKIKQGEGIKVGEQTMNQLKQQLQKSIKDVKTELQTKDKATNEKLEDLSKKYSKIQTTAQKEKGQQKKVGEQSLIQLKDQLQKQIRQLQVKVSEMEARQQKEDQQQAINNLRKSMNKLQAMVFSEQAKNKALFDRLTDDVSKVSQNLSMLANQMRE